MNDSLKNNQKIRWYNVAIIICVYIICSSIPFARWINDSNIVFIINLSLLILFLVFAYFFIKKEKLFTKHLNKPKKEDLLFLPLILLGMSNFVFAWIFKSPNSSSNNSLWQSIISTLIITLCEELIFRTILLEEFLSNTKLKPELSILFSSLIFGFIHIVNISSLESIPYVLMQCGYTFVFGLMVGIVYYYSRNLIYPFIIHFSFNLLNSVLFTYFYQDQNTPQYIVFSILYGLIFLVYTCIIYVVLKKKHNYVS